VVVGLDDGGINDYITDKKSGYLVKSEKEAAETVVYLLENPYERECCHIAAREEAKKKIMSLDERFGREVKLIEDVAIKRK
jgi:glycosyltransferase involved in cell wall biosynthesis